MENLSSEFINDFKFFNFDYQGKSLDIMKISFSPDKFREKLFFHFDIECPNSVRESVPKRKREFLAGRICTKYLIKMNLGYEVDVPISADRSPKWPCGLTGSISHTDNSAIAIVGKKEHSGDNLSFGIDIQTLMSQQQSKSIQPLIADITELLLLKKLNYSNEYCTTLLFSAKESIYKAIYPHIMEIVNFDAVNLVNINHHKSILTFSTSTNLNKNFNINKIITCNYRYDTKRNEITTLCLYKPRN